MDVIGMLAHALHQLMEATWRSFNGHVATAVTGMLVHVMKQLVDITWRCCSGCMPMAAVPGSLLSESFI